MPIILEIAEQFTRIFAVSKLIEICCEPPYHSQFSKQEPKSKFIEELIAGSDPRDERYTISSFGIFLSSPVAFAMISGAV